MAGTGLRTQMGLVKASRSMHSPWFCSAIEVAYCAVGAFQHRLDETTVLPKARTYIRSTCIGPMNRKSLAGAGTSVHTS